MSAEEQSPPSTHPGPARDLVTLVSCDSARLADLLTEGLAAPDRCVAALLAGARREIGGPNAARWVFPAALDDTDGDMLRPLWSALGRIDSAVIEISLESAAAEGDWPRAIGSHLYAATRRARQLAARMPEAGGSIVLLAVNLPGAAPLPIAAEIARAGVITLAHGLAKALSPRLRVAALVDGPVEGARPGGQRKRAAVTVDTIATAAGGLLRSPVWASGTILHLANPDTTGEE